MHSFVAKYMRVSVAQDGDMESHSIQNQRLILDEYLKAREEFSGMEALEFVDDGYSGTNLMRPALRRMLEKVSAGEIACILVKDFSRLCRDYLQAGVWLEEFFPGMGIRFISVNDQYDSKEPFRANSLEAPFKGILNELYSRDLSKKVLAAKCASFQKGKTAGGAPPFGYQKVCGTAGGWAPVPEAAAVVQKIFELAAAGQGDTAIAKVLNQAGTPTPGVFKSGENGKKYRIWNAGMVKTVLLDERYTGTAQLGRYQSAGFGKRYCVRRPESMWYIFPNAHPPIVAPAVFFQVQAMRKQETGWKKQKKPVHPWKGKLLCGGCRKGLYHKTGENSRFYCRTPRLLEKAPCSIGTVSEEALAAAAWSSISAFLAADGSGKGERKRNCSTQEATGRVCSWKHREGQEEEAGGKERKTGEAAMYMAGYARLYEVYCHGTMERKRYLLEKRKRNRWCEEETQRENRGNGGADAGRTAGQGLIVCAAWVQAFIQKVVIFEKNRIELYVCFSEFWQKPLHENGSMNHLQ